MSIDNSRATHTPAGIAMAGHVRSPYGPLPEVAVVLTDRAGVQVGRTGSGAGGEFRFTGLRPDTYVVIASAKGHRPRAEMVTLGATGTAEPRLTLEPAESVHGIVHERLSGEPVAAATVTALDAHGEVIASTVSEPDGAYHIGGVEGTELTLVATAAAAEPTVAVARLDRGDAPDHVVDLALDTYSTLTGAITADGGAVVHLPLTLRDGNGHVVATTVTDEHGTYRFERVTPGTYTIHGPAGSPSATPVPPDATTAHVTLS